MKQRDSKKKRKKVPTLSILLLCLLYYHIYCLRHIWKLNFVEFFLITEPRKVQTHVQHSFYYCNYPLIDHKSLYFHDENSILLFEDKHILRDMYEFGRSTVKESLSKFIH